MKLKQKLGAIFVVIAILPFLSGMVFIMQKTSRTINTDANGYMSEYADNIAAEIAAFFSDKFGYVEAFANLDSVKQFDWPAVKGDFSRTAEDSGAFASFILVRKDGTYYNSASPGNPAQEGLITKDNKDPNSEPITLVDRDYFKRLITDNTSNEKLKTLSAPNLSKSTGKKQIVVATNVMDRNKNVAGLLAVTVTAGYIVSILDRITAKTEQAFGTGAMIAIISDKGDLVALRAYNKTTKMYEEQVLNQDKEFTIDSLPEAYRNIAAESAGKHEVFLPIRDPETRAKMHVAGSAIPGTNYYLYLTLPDAVIYQAVAEIYSSIVTICVAMILIVLVVSLLLGRSLVGPILETARTLKDISEGSGDLTYRIKLEGKDEIAEVGKHFNKFVETLHAMISQVKSESETMAGISANLQEHAQGIKTGIESISVNVTDLNFQTDEQSASVTETSSTIHQIAKNIESLTQQIGSQSASVTESSAAIQQMVSNINSISMNLDRAGGGFEILLTTSGNGRDSMQNVIELVKDVSSQSEHLLETNEIIDAIASQTNLLAMNAAIEAAHAGEAGKGFSVVSDEIRKLAESSSEQSKVIAGELKKVVNTITTIVDASAKADDAFGIVATQIKDANGLIQEIRMAMKEQTEGSQQVLEALEEIQNITVEIRDGSMEMNQGAAMILKEMARLEDVSRKVQSSTQNIARSSDAIGRKIENIIGVTGKNTEVVQNLSSLTNRFKL